MVRPATSPGQLFRRPEPAYRQLAARPCLRQRPATHRRRRQGPPDPGRRRLHPGRRPLGKERAADQVQHRGPQRLHGLRDRRAAHRQPTQRPGLRSQLRRRAGRAVVRRLPGGALRLDGPLGHKGKPDLLLRGLAGLHPVRTGGKSAGGDWERFDSPAAQAALTQFEGTDDRASAAAGPQRPTGHHVGSGAGDSAGVRRGLVRVQHEKYTGWPTQSDQYTNPVPNAPYLEYTLLHLTPAS